jgi:hypothetical protein
MAKVKFDADVVHDLIRGVDGLYDCVIGYDDDGGMPAVDDADGLMSLAILVDKAGALAEVVARHARGAGIARHGDALMTHGQIVSTLKHMISESE